MTFPNSCDGRFHVHPFPFMIMDDNCLTENYNLRLLQLLMNNIPLHLGMGNDHMAFLESIMHAVFIILFYT